MQYLAWMGGYSADEADATGSRSVEQQVRSSGSTAVQKPALQGTYSNKRAIYRGCHPELLGGSTSATSGSELCPFCPATGAGV